MVRNLMTDHYHCIRLASFVHKLFTAWNDLIFMFTLGEVFHPGPIVEWNALFPAGVACQNEKTCRQTYTKKTVTQNETVKVAF